MPMVHDNAHGQGGVMHMTFFWGNQVLILFPGWPGNAGIRMYLVSLLFVFCLAALAEVLSAVSTRLASRSSASVAILLSVMHALRVGVAYLVMLAVMSFNVGVFLVAVAGHALGFLLVRSGLFLDGEHRDLEAHRRLDNASKV
ncbi:hypothetical protein LUZ60_004107 [Juncus effusus]|nr:hypothetical protein LUZ60_004107 [Juncus effusus]